MAMKTQQSEGQGQWQGNLRRDKSLNGYGYSNPYLRPYQSPDYNYRQSGTREYNLSPPFADAYNRYVGVYNRSPPYVGVYNRGAPNARENNRGPPYADEYNRGSHYADEYNRSPPYVGVYNRGAPNASEKNRGSPYADEYNRGSPYADEYNRGSHYADEYNHGTPNAGEYNRGSHYADEYNHGTHNAGEYNGGPPNSGENNRGLDYADKYNGGPPRVGDYHYGPRKSHKYRPDPYEIQDSRERNMIPLTTFNHSGHAYEENIPTVSGQMEPPEQRIDHTGQDEPKHEGSSKTSMGKKIFYRTLSIGFICLNIAADWIEYNDWLHDEPDASSDAVSIAASIFGQKAPSISVECSATTRGAIVSLAFINGLGSLMALIQIVDTVGETVLEASKGERGFQILHGWIETVLTLFLEEIPQAVIVLLINNSCRYNLNVSIFSLVTVLLGMIKTSSRMKTCKQKSEPCTCDCRCTCDFCDCSGCCDFSDCCKYTIPIPCACRTCIFEPCECGESCIRIEKWNICPNFSCRPNCKGISCFGGKKQDPKWAKKVFSVLTYFNSLLFVANIIFLVLNLFNIQVDLI